MFIYIKYGDNHQFMVNSNCHIFSLLHYARAKLGLAKTEIIDLCDEMGTMKLFFLTKTPEDFASKYLTARHTYYVCKVIRGAQGTRLQNAFLAFVPFLKSPSPALMGALRTQCDMLEKSRLKMIKMQEAAQKVALAESSMKLSGKSGKTKGPYHKTRVDFLRKKDKKKKNKK